MAKIKIYGDSNKGCIFFDGSTVQPKFLGTIIASVKADETDRIVIQRTDRFNRDGVTFRTLFRRLKATRVQNEAGEDLINDLGYSVADVVVYINEQASSYSSGGSVRPALDEHPNFVLDPTQTTIMVDNGENFGVNTLKAILGPDGLVDIVSSDHSGNAITHYEDCPHENLQINGSFISGGPQDVVDALNELFTVGPFESVVIRDPYSTMIADVDGEFAGHSLVGTTAQDPAGNDIFTNLSSGNYAGLKSTATIDQAGEYYTFDIRGEGQIGFGLIHSDASFAAGKYIGNANYADPSTFAVGNSAHYGWQFSHWFHPTPNGSWTNYGASTAYSVRPGWYNWDQKQDWLDGNPVKIRVGIDNNGFISIESLQDDGSWVVHARTSYPVPEGSEFHLGIKAANSAPRVYSAPKVHLLEPAAPTLYFRWIESPDGTYSWPLFATEEEANYYDANHTIGSPGSGTSHTHVYPDDPTNTTWYMPDTGSTMTDTSDPVGVTFAGQNVNWTEITSLSNADLAPPAFADTTVSVDEGAAFNYQTQPQDVGYTTTITGSPSNPFISFAGMLNGIAPEVTGDNVANPSDDYVLTVTRTNSYGSSTGTLTVTVNNLTAPTVTAVNGVTHEAASTALVDSDTLGDGSVVKLDDILNDGNRVVMDLAFVSNYIMPMINSGSGDKSVWVGFGKETGGSPNWADSVSASDFELAFEFFENDVERTNNRWRLRVYKNGTQVANVGIGSNSTGLYNYVLVNEGGTIKIAGLLPSYGDATSFEWDGSAMSWDYEVTGLAVQSRDIYIGTNGTNMDLPNPFSGFTEVTEPAPAPTILTDWNKAIDFDGSSERLQIVDSSYYRVAMKMSGTNNTVAGGSKLITSSDANARPWATAIVFKVGTYNSNQHVWNVGEGSGDTDDNIYLRRDANRNLWFGIGRPGDLCECYIGSVANNMGAWHGVYIAHSGARFGSGNTAADLENAFDFRYTNSASNWAVGSNQSTQANWNSGTVGGRMNRQYDGYFTIGGRGANRSFRGKIASFVSTTLRRNAAMPSDAEIAEMITDPIDWLWTYKEGNPFRLPWQSGDAGFNFSVGDGSSSYGTQVWLMGDGNNDSYSNMIRNRVLSSDQNYTKMNMISMVSNDIQNVTISGLS